MSILLLTIRVSQDEHWGSEDKPHASALDELVRQAMSDSVDDNDCKENHHDHDSKHVIDLVLFVHFWFPFILFRC